MTLSKATYSLLISSSAIGAAMMAATPAFAAVSAAANYDDAEPIIVTGKTDGYVTKETVSATKTNTAVKDVPQSITVFNEEQIEDQAIQELGDVLRYVPGVSVGQGEGHRDQITLRGQNTTADFFVDGLRDDIQYFRPIYNVERVEVLKGPNAMIFGRGGGGGVVNRVIKTPQEGDSFGDATLSVDSFGAFSISTDANFASGENEAVRFNGIYEEFNNHRDEYNGRRIAVNPSYAAHLGESTRLLLAYEFVHDRRVTDRGIPSLNNEPIDGYYDAFFGEEGVNDTTLKMHNFKARLEHEFNDNVEVNITSQYTDYDKFYRNVYARSATATTVELDSYDNGTKRQNFVTQANLIWNSNIGALDHILLVGAEYGNQQSVSERSNGYWPSTNSTRLTLPISGFATGTATLPEILFPTVTSASDSDAEFFGAYVQSQLKFGDLVELVGGVRYDRFELSTVNRINNFAASRNDDKFSPRIGLIVKPTQQISLYSSYAKSFLPQSGDQFSVLDASTSSLAPESFTNYELGMKWDIASDLAFTAAIYQLDRTNTRASDPLNPALIVLTGETRTKGFETQLSGNITPNWQASLAYSYQEGEIRSTTTSAPAGRLLAQLPKHQFAAWTRYDVSDNFGFGLGLTHQSSQFASISNTTKLPSYTRVDAALYHDLSEDVQVQLNVENLFDAEYFPSAHNDNNISTGEPFNVRATIKFGF
ncbi:TonB-dependent receptor [Sphingorhabdus lutea]|uniref:TonB-dependent receptor n=1 Tax=Sphingorhabdus lutea TaxID=1913578 RepID=A0A1L3JFC5_9SPHN|nr:TonB-dependent siderophore receptor [Sphingorhabdus lutea]APG63826.1 TonB-dependent receptor [Sphingorhabdus lutea]